MTALTADRKTRSRLGNKLNFGLEESTKIFQGSMVGLNSAGYLVPAAATSTIVILGMALAHVDNSDGADGDLECEVMRGVFRWENSAAADEISLDDVGSLCYAVDDQTVALTSDSGNRPPAGYIIDVDADGVWVEHRQLFPGGADGDLVAANNLSDVASASSSRGNLGIIQNLQFQDVNLVGGDAAQYRYVHSGPDATINHIRSVLSDSLATGNATITADIDGTPVDDGVVTITQVGSAEDDVDVANPSAANVISEGEVLTLTVGGTNDATVTANLTVELSY